MRGDFERGNHVLQGRNILLGITGSIAAYKSADVARRLMDEGAVVHAVMTDAATRFIPPYTLEALTGNRVHTDLFSDPFTHISLSKNADLFLVAPATANTINKVSCGIADNLLSTLWLTYEGPSLIAPAMNEKMYRHASVQDSVKTLRKRGVSFVGPISGGLACGDEGVGRMADVPEIVEAAVTALTPKDFDGIDVLVTAGPTREAIDPVRFISNRSSGKMGYALARAAKRRGARVTIISGPSSEEPPYDVAYVPVESALDMEKAVLKHLPRSEVLIMSAAVADFTPSVKSKVKYEKSGIKSLNLKKTSDILKKAAGLKKRCFLVGFAAETGSAVDRARKKLRDKNLDLIVLNDVSQEGAGFDVDTNIITIIDKRGGIAECPLMKKSDAANVILDRILALKAQKKN